jgi:hypothetical protein
VSELHPQHEAACGRCHSPVDRGDLRCAVCSFPIPESGSAAAERRVARVLRCDGCGAAITYDVEVRAPRCAFCDSVAHLEETEDPLEEAQWHLPFTVEPTTARGALSRWLSSRGFFAPSDLASQSTVDALTPLYWVGWTFDVEALVSWAADSDHGSHRSAWAPHAGQSPIELANVLVSASRGLTEEETQALADRYDLGSARADRHAPEATVVERFDVQRSAARHIIAAAVARAAAGHASTWIPGTSRRNLHVAVLPRRLVTRRYAFPAYVLAYRYRDTLYRAIIHGQDATRVLGKSPKSWLKIALVVGGVTLAVLALVALTAALILFAN